MGSGFIIFLHPPIQVGLQLLDGTIELLAEGDAVELVQDSLVEALTDAVGLAAVLGPSIGQDPLQRDAVLVKEGNHSVVQESYWKDP